MDMMRQGWSTSLFHAAQQWSTRSSYDLKIRFESQLSRMNCHTFSTVRMLQVRYGGLLAAVYSRDGN